MTEKQQIWDWLKAEWRQPYLAKVARNQRARNKRPGPDDPRPVPNRASRRTWKRALRKGQR